MSSDRPERVTPDILAVMRKAGHHDYVDGYEQCQAEVLAAIDGEWLQAVEQTAHDEHEAERRKAVLSVLERLRMRWDGGGR